MHLVIIRNDREASSERAQALAAALGVTAFDARQRLVGQGPVLVASCAEPQPAEDLLSKLQQAGFTGLTLDAESARRPGAFLGVRRLAPGAETLRIETVDGRSGTLSYPKIDRLLLASRISGQTEVQKVTERKLSMGKTLLAGGVPMTTKVTRQEVTSSEERETVLFMAAGNRPRFVCSCNGMLYDGLGDGMLASREQNFNLLVAELRRRAPGAVFDDRLLTRAAQARVLGPLLSPEAHLDLAVEILIRSGGNGAAAE